MTDPLAGTAGRHHPIGGERLGRAGALLAALHAGGGATPRVADVAPLGHEWAPVTRLRLDPPLVTNDGDTHRSVVVKTRRTDGDGYGNAPFLRREAAGLAIATSSGVGPRLLAADQPAGVVVAEDIAERGATVSLEDVLLGADEGRAQAAFLATARSLGTLHAATGRCSDRFATLVEAGDASPPWPWSGADAWQVVIDACRTLGFPDAGTPDVVTEMGDVLQALETPGDDEVLLHGDVHPRNVLLDTSGERAWLVDFEGSRPAHAGVDACALFFPFPNWSPSWAVLPPSLIETAGAVYRTAAGITAARHDRLLAVGGAAALAVRLQRLPRIAPDEQPAPERWRRRAQMVQQLRSFVPLSSRTGHLPAFGAWCEQAAEAMCDRWPDAGEPPPPRYPAFVDA